MRTVALVEGWPLGETGDALDARTAALAAGEAFSEAAPTHEIVAVAVGDGGPRSADAWPGERALVGGVETVAHADATWLLPRAGAVRWNPVDLSTALLGLASAHGPAAPGVPRPTVVVPLGDATPAGDAASLWGSSVTSMRQVMGALDLVALTASHRPLLGFQGMSAGILDGRESDAALAAAAQEQERRWADIAREGDAAAQRGDLLGPQRLSDLTGTGAAGGLAYALAALGARLVPASRYLAEAAGVGEALRGASLVLGIAGAVVTPRALDHGVAAAVAGLGGSRGIPVAVLAPGVQVGKRDLMAAGVAAAHEGEATSAGLAAAVGRVAHTWAR